MNDNALKIPLLSKEGCGSSRGVVDTVILFDHPVASRHPS